MVKWDEDEPLVTKVAKPIKPAPSPAIDPALAQMIGPAKTPAPQPRARHEDPGLDDLLRDLDHLSFNPRLNSHYRTVCARAATIIRKK